MACQISTDIDMQLLPVFIPDPFSCHRASNPSPGQSPHFILLRRPIRTHYSATWFLLHQSGSGVYISHATGETNERPRCLVRECPWKLATNRLLCVESGLVLTVVVLPRLFPMD